MQQKRPARRRPLTTRYSFVAVAVLAGCSNAPTRAPAAGSAPLAASPSPVSVPATPSPSATTPTPASARLTLITGDHVTVTTGPRGEQRTTVEPGPGRAGISFIHSTVARREHGVRS